jgi:hypothetical protein
MDGKIHLSLNDDWRGEGVCLGWHCLRNKTANKERHLSIQAKMSQQYCKCWRGRAMHLLRMSLWKACWRRIGVSCPSNPFTPTPYYYYSAVSLVAKCETSRANDGFLLTGKACIFMWKDEPIRGQCLLPQGSFWMQSSEYNLCLKKFA